MTLKAGKEAGLLGSQFVSKDQKQLLLESFPMEKVVQGRMWREIYQSHPLPHQACHSVFPTTLPLHQSHQTWQLKAMSEDTVGHHTWIEDTLLSSA